MSFAILKQALKTLGKADVAKLAADTDFIAAFKGGSLEDWIKNSGDDIAKLSRSERVVFDRMDAASKYIADPSNLAKNPKNFTDGLVEVMGEDMAKYADLRNMVVLEAARAQRAAAAAAAAKTAPPAVTFEQGLRAADSGHSFKMNPDGSWEIASGARAPEAPTPKAEAPEATKPATKDTPDASPEPRAEPSTDVETPAVDPEALEAAASTRRTAPPPPLTAARTVDAGNNVAKITRKTSYLPFRLTDLKQLYVRGRRATAKAGRVMLEGTVDLNKASRPREFLNISHKRLYKGLEGLFGHKGPEGLFRQKNASKNRT